MFSSPVGVTRLVPCVVTWCNSLFFLWKCWRAQSAAEAKISYSCVILQNIIVSIGCTGAGWLEPCSLCQLQPHFSNIWSLFGGCKNSCEWQIKMTFLRGSGGKETKLVTHQKDGGNNKFRRAWKWRCCCRAEVRRWVQFAQDMPQCAPEG